MPLADYVGNLVGDHSADPPVFYTHEQFVAATQPLIDRVVDGRYQIIKPLSTGGMGSVFLAEQEPLGRRVALKLLADKLAEIANTPTLDEVLDRLDALQTGNLTTADVVAELRRDRDSH